MEGSLSESLLSTVAEAAATSRDFVAAYSILGVSIAFEVFGTLCMRMASENAFWRVGAYGAYAVAFSLLPFSLETIPLSVAYSTWSALGTLFVALLSRCLFGEVLTTMQLCGVVGTAASVVFLHADAFSRPV